MTDLDGRVALVTGAARAASGGRPRAVLAGRGASVVIADIDEAGAAETAALIGDDDQIAVVRADVTDEPTVATHDRVRGRALRPARLRVQRGRISVEPKPFVEHDARRLAAGDRRRPHRRVPVHAARAAADARAGHGGAIVNVSSGAGRGARAGPAALHGGEARGARAHQARRAGVRARRDPRERGAARPDRDRTDEGLPRCAARPRRAAPAPDADGPHGATRRRSRSRSRGSAPTRRRTSTACRCSSTAARSRDDDPQSVLARVPRRPVPGVPRAARRTRPATTTRTLDFWALSRYDDVLAALHDPDTYCSRYGITLEQDNPLPMLLTTDPPDHTELRRLVSRAFTPRRVADLEPEIRALARRSSADSSRTATGDLVADYAARLPMDVIARMLGVPAARRGAAPRSGRTRCSTATKGVPDVTPAGVAAATHLYKYFCDFVADRRAAVAAGHAPDDLTTALCVPGRGADALADEQVVGLLLPADHRRQRDHHEAARQLPARVAAVPERAAQGRGRSGPDPRRGRGDPALRRIDAAHGAHADPAGRAARRADARGRQGVAAARLGEPRRAGVGPARRVRHRSVVGGAARRASATASTCASAPRSPGSRCA